MAGSMRVRAKEKDGIVTVKALITHPMETGLRKDSDGNIVPAHFIQEVTATVGGEVVFTANWGTGLWHGRTIWAIPIRWRRRSSDVSEG